MHVPTEMRRVASLSFAALLCAGTACSSAQSAQQKPDLVLRPFVSTDAAGDAFLAYAAANGLQAWNVPYEQDRRSEGAEIPSATPENINVDGLGWGEAVVRLDPEDPSKLAFRTPPYSSGCEPSPETGYGVAQAADGGVVIVRLVPEIHVTTEHHPGDCAVGCGPVPPPPASAILRLPPTLSVRVITVPWEAKVVRITCDHPIGRP